VAMTLRRRAFRIPIGPLSEVHSDISIGAYAALDMSQMSQAATLVHAIGLSYYKAPAQIACSWKRMLAYGPASMPTGLHLALVTPYEQPMRYASPNLVDCL
jgi:hypothetical protein